MATLNTTMNSIPASVTATIRFTRRLQFRLWLTFGLMKLAAMVAPFEFQVRKYSDEEGE
jgi:hypothetical protein